MNVCLMIGKMNVILRTCDLLCGLEGHTLLVLGISIFCERPPATAGTTSGSLLTSSEIKRIWEKKIEAKGSTKSVSGISSRKLLEAQWECNNI